MAHRVLWIEDSARFELRNLAGPVYISSKYHLQHADDVTSAIAYVQNHVYEVLIVDIRLPPGSDSHWRRMNGGSEKLGIQLLYWLLAPADSYPDKPPAWVQPARIGVFTVEARTEIATDLAKLGIEEFCQKRAGLADTALRDMIDRILVRNGW